MNEDNVYCAKIKYIPMPHKKANDGKFKDIISTEAHVCKISFVQGDKAQCKYWLYTNDDCLNCDFILVCANEYGSLKSARLIGWQN